MTLTFDKDGSTYYGVVKDTFYKGRIHDELLFCEIEEGGMLRWEDSYFSKHVFSTTEVAMSAAKKEFLKHTPHSNGLNYESWHW